MRAVPPELLSKLQNRQKFIRNICILAHVDHGKTTLADTLVASNGIISQKLAGKMRYMDSLEEEQLRGITMKSSAISLYYPNDPDHYLINLIDSPGHIDFSSEVSTAVRLCDGAVIVIDAVEGVSPQTHAVLRQAWTENLRPVLLVNKLDRLIVELKLTPSEANTHLSQILEQVNAVMAQLISGEILRRTAAVNAKQQECPKSPTKVTGPDGEVIEETTPTVISYNWDSGQHADENDDAHLYFSPDIGNVVFGSALDNWAFSIKDFTRIYSAKLGLNEAVLNKTLWGDFYLNSKTKRVHRGAVSAGKKNLFVQMILDNIWKIYDTILAEYRDTEQIEKMMKVLDIKVQPKELRSTDNRAVLQAVMSRWLPISKSTLAMVVDKIPSPLEMSENRVNSLMCDHSVSFDSLHPQTRALKPYFKSCSTGEDDPVIVYVSKMCPMDKDIFPENQKTGLTKADLEQRKEIARLRHKQKMDELSAEKSDIECHSSIISTASHDTPNVDHENTDQVKVSIDETPPYKLIAFARIFSGTLRKGQKLYVLGPKHNPKELLSDDTPSSPEEPVKIANSLEELTADQHVTQFTVTDLYTFMGRELDAMDSIPAGNIVGIGGLESHILKTATISSTLACCSFTDMQFEAQPIVRVAVEPKHPTDMAKLVRGMKLLNQADSCVQVFAQETGEYVLVAAGEVHLQRCIDDLRKRYANIQIDVSSPIVPFRETIAEPRTVDMVNEAIEGENIVHKSNKKSDSKKEMHSGEEEEESKVIKMTRGDCTIAIEALPLPTNVSNLIDANQTLLQSLDLYLSGNLSGSRLSDESIQKLKDLKEKIDELYRMESTNPEWKSLSDRVWSFGPRKYGPNLLVNSPDSGYRRPSIWDLLDNPSLRQQLREHDSSVINGFQITTLSGPLCAEPMRGVMFVVRRWVLASANELSAPLASLSLQPEKDFSDHESETGSRKSGSLISSNFGGVLHAGQVISVVKEACKRAFQAQPQRLMVAMYSCNIQSTATVLGKVYGVIGKRSGRVLNEDMQEGTQTFNIAAVLPVAESFGFSDEMRKKTSGLASPQLAFSHWEALEVDPYWEPCTEEEITHFGEKYDSENRALNYMNNVRRRKGLKLDEKLVIHAEKQRNLGRNK